MTEKKSEFHLVRYERLVVFLSHIASANCPACASFSTTLGARHSPDQAKTHGAGEQDGNKIRHS